jgi:putative DNA primase/helicase
MSSKRELRFGTKGSFSVKIGGSKAGCWYNFETSVGGDIFDLIRIEHSGDFNDVIAFARDFCGGRTIRTSRSTPANQQPVPVEEHSLDWLARWNEGQEPRGSIVEAYLASRGLQLPDELANTVLRFHPALYHKPQGRGVPGMMALLRNVIGNEPTGVIRSFFDQQGRKIDRLMMGSAGG